MNALLTTAHHSDTVKNVVTGSTIIFFDEEDQIDPTKTHSPAAHTTEVQHEKLTENLFPAASSNAQSISDESLQEDSSSNIHVRSVLVDNNIEQLSQENQLLKQI